MISFNIPLTLGNEINFVEDAVTKGKFCGDGFYTKQCQEIIQTLTGSRKVLLTPSCTAALELAALLINIEPGDEIIMPSYTFVSTANAFALRGAKIVFADIRPDTMNIDENKIVPAISAKTKAIVPVHYAGVCCEMNAIMEIAHKHNLWVIEDAAQSVMSTYKNKYPGAIGHIGCYSFHETKNYQCGEGGAILVNDNSLIERAEIIREKGTDRSKFLRGQVDKYSWVDIGSSFLLSDLNAAFIYPQLKDAQKINEARLEIWNHYYYLLSDLNHHVDLPVVPEECKHNGHMFYIKCKDINERQNLITHLKKEDIQSVFHYIPLHSSAAGKKFGAFHGKDEYTTKESERLLRLPFYYGLKKEDVEKVCNSVKRFYKR